MAVKQVTSATFEADVQNAAGTVLLDFWAPWCGPCRMVAPILEEVAEARPDVSVCKVNVDEESELAGKFGVMSIPTLVVLRGGEVVSRTVGARPKAQILALLDA